jgi:long-chain acyl-CoA synthetase
MGACRILGAMPPELETKPFQQCLESVVRRFPDKVALAFKSANGYRRVTYGDLYRQARGVATGLLALGLNPGDRAAVLSENRPEWVIAYLGIMMAGGVVVPLDTQISPAEWRNLLDDCEARYAFVSGALLPGLRVAVAAALQVPELIVMDPSSDPDASRRVLPAFIEWALSLTPPGVLPQGSLADLVVTIYTSGTTGRPKGVMLTQQNIVSEILSALGAIHADERDTLLCLLPLQHVLPSVVGLLLPLYLGAQVNFLDTLKRPEILEALEEGKVTVVATVPQFFYLFHRRIMEELAQKLSAARWTYIGLRLLNRFCLRALHLNLGRVLFARIHRVFGSRTRLFVSGGSAFDPKVAQEFFDLGFTILQGYGLTETAGGCATTREHNNVIGSVGPALPGVEIRIDHADDNGVGEIVIRGPMVMKGYYNNPEATAEVLRDGWLYSGDLGRLDRAGNLFVVGRKKEVIVLANGKNIYPDEMEAYYGQCRYVKEIAVIGVADSTRAERGDRLHAVIVPDFDLLKAERIANAREVIRDEVATWSNQLPGYKRLMSYQLQADPLPRTTTRKIRRLELKRLIESGQLCDSQPSPGEKPASPEDQVLVYSEAGQEVIACLRDTYHRDKRIDLGANLELDLGFDSMERAELMTSLERALGLKLPDDFGADILTVRDLVTRLQSHVGTSPRAEGAVPRGWGKVLSAESLASDPESRIKFSGPAFSLFKYFLARSLYIVFRLVFRLEAHGLENLPRRGPFMLCPNHLSYIDPFVLLSVLPRRTFRSLFYVGYAAFFQSATMKFLARLASIVLVDPDAHLLGAMKAGAWGLRQGQVLCIFPEGGRSFDGKLQEFRKGAAILAREVGVPMVPVALRGTYEVWPRDSRRIRMHNVTIRIGAPIRASDGGYQRDIERVRDAVAELLRQ